MLWTFQIQCASVEEYSLEITWKRNEENVDT